MVLTPNIKLEKSLQIFAPLLGEGRIHPQLHTTAGVHTTAGMAVVGAAAVAAAAAAAAECRL
jgi:hypothetical protein